MVVGLVFRLAVIDESFWYDEAVSADRYFSSSPVDIVSTNHPNNHPLYSLSVRVLWEVFGESELTARLPSLAAWGVVLFMMWWMARRWISPSVGVLSIILGVLAYWQIRYSVEARGNELAAALGLVAMAMLTVGLEARRRLVVLGSAVVLGLAAFAHLYAATLAVAVLVVWLAGRVRSAGDLRRELVPMLQWAAIFGTVLVLVYLPAQNLVRVVAGLVLRGEAPGAGALTTRIPVSGSYMLEVSRGWLTGVPTAIGAGLLVVPYGLGLWSVRKRPYALALLAAPIVVLSAAVASTFLFFERFLVVLQPYVLLAVAAGVHFLAISLFRNRHAVAAAGATVVLALTLVPAGGLPETLPMQVRAWDDAAAYIDTEGSGLVLANPILEGWSPVRDTLGYYLTSSLIVEPAETGVTDGTRFSYVRRLGGAPEPGLSVVLGPPVVFGEIEVYDVVWRDGGLEPAG